MHLHSLLVCSPITDIEDSTQQPPHPLNIFLVVWNYYKNIGKCNILPFCFLSNINLTTRQRRFTFCFYQESLHWLIQRLLWFHLKLLFAVRKLLLRYVFNCSRFTGLVGKIIFFFKRQLYYPIIVYFYFIAKFCLGQMFTLTTVD